MSSVWGRGGIFISYRREDTAAQARPLYDRLSARFGEDRVFMDVHSISLGVDFTEEVIGTLAVCNVLLAVIGQSWSAITDSKGTRQLDNPCDWVRVEIEIALQRDIRVVPVLVDGAMLPQADSLPESLQPLIRRQASKLGDTSFESDVTRLIADIHAAVERVRPGQLTVTRVHASEVDVPALAEELRVWYENQGLEAILVTIPTALMVQCRPRKRPERTSGGNALLSVILQDKDEDLRVEIGSAKWLGRVDAAKASTAVAGLAAASWLLPPVLPLAAGAAAVGVGARRWRQARLSDQTINFLREMAPMHIRGAF